MKKLAIASALLSAMALTGTAAHAYQTEIGASAGVVDQDVGGTNGSFGVDGTYYFNPVQTRNAPLAEAAFLDRASNVSAQYQYDEVGNNDRHRYGVGAEYFVPNSDFYLSGNIGRDDYENFDETVYAALSDCDAVGEFVIGENSAEYFTCKMDVEFTRDNIK